MTYDSTQSLANVFNERVIADQRSVLLDLYREHVGKGSDYVLLDFPDHSNVGDSAIWVGEIELLREVTGRDPSYVSTHTNFDAEEMVRCCPDGVIFIHGGGNLGDIWEHHQIFREQIIDKFRDRRVVQLPQSIKFRDPSRVTQFAKLVDSHPDFHLYVRDHASLAFAREHFGCPTGLAPDSAFGMGALKRSDDVCEVLLLMRTDLERTDYNFADFKLLGDKEIVDWLGDPKAFRVKAKVHKLFNSSGSRVDWYNQIARERVARGAKLLSRGRFVITDRLHGHIMSTLLDIPHVALDNDYGKVSSYIAAWTKSYPAVQTALTAREAVCKLTISD